MESLGILFGALAAAAAGMQVPRLALADANRPAGRDADGWYTLSAGRSPWMIWLAGGILMPVVVFAHYFTGGFVEGTNPRHLVLIVAPFFIASWIYLVRALRVRIRFDDVRVCWQGILSQPRCCRWEDFASATWSSWRCELVLRDTEGVPLRVGAMTGFAEFLSEAELRLRPAVAGKSLVGARAMLVRKANSA